ncbi:radical SAM protein [Candidatus Woesearchaeota archaeon]|nr:radical SAM protein [Candidatus Woesearchaeota archaeon]
MKKKLLLIYPPFCTPTNPPYSLFYLPAVIKANSGFAVKVLDFNVIFHRKLVGDYFSTLNNYENQAEEFFKKSGKIYRKANRLVRENKELPLLRDFVELVEKEKPDFIAFSCIYNQQIFYASKIAEYFKGRIKTVIGGPAASNHAKSCFDLVTDDLGSFARFLGIQLAKWDFGVDYNCLDISQYYTPKIVYPIRSSIGCCYAQCAFCNQHGFKNYFEFDIEQVAEQINTSNKMFFDFIDDAVPVDRLVKLKNYLNPGVRYLCYSRIDNNPSLDKFRKIHDSGCRLILWGVESGSEKMLKLMNKGINLEGIEKTLYCSAKAGIKNSIYIIVGFPGETEETLKETISFLKKNKENIHLLCPNIFNVQPNSDVCKNPGRYGINRIIEKKRLYLPPSYNYKSDKYSHKEYIKLKAKYKKELESINKYSTWFGVFKDHFLIKAGS